MEKSEDLRRKGDAAKIDGAYQHRALTSGPAVQRFWHHSKMSLLDWMFEIKPGERVLDVGCGSGVFSHAMSERGANVLGIDANQEAIAYANETFQTNLSEFKLGLLDELDLEPDSFDRATCLEVVEHVYEHQALKLLTDIRRILRVGGELLLTTPNYRGLWPVVEWAVDHFSSLARMDADQHITHFDRKQLCRMVVDAGFTVEKVRTYSTVAPFLAPLSWRAASAMESIERRVDMPFGNILALVARRIS